MNFWSEVGGSLPTLDFDQVDPDINVVIIHIVSGGGSGGGGGGGGSGGGCSGSSGGVGGGDGGGSGGV